MNKKPNLEKGRQSQDPRKGPTLGTMVCWHPRYNLGDCQPVLSPQQWLLALGSRADKLLEKRLSRYPASEQSTVIARAIAKEFILLPLGPFEGVDELGYIYVPKQRAAEHLKTLRFGPYHRQRTLAILSAEIEAYQAFLRRNEP